MLFDLAQPILRHLRPEASQSLALHALKLTTPIWRRRPGTERALPTTCFGLQFKNPLGLAAGCDKNGDFLNALGAVGFGFVEVGTVTPRPQGGNARPRLWRIPSKLAVVNRMGFNNKGVDYVVDRLKCRSYTGICGVNIGKNADTPNDRAEQDYLECFSKVYPHADYVTLNLSSPNTSGLRALQSRAGIEQVAGAVVAARNRLRATSGRYVPILLKIAPDLSEKELSGIADSVQHVGLDGVVATNTSTDLEPVTHLAPSVLSGGLSGEPLLERSLPVIRALRAHLGPTMPIVGVGGITSADAALRMLQAGASLIQIYTGFVYRGPALVSEIMDRLDAHWAPNTLLERAHDE
jgi:dihydroorotate dehydrogenase